MTTTAITALWTAGCGGDQNLNALKEQNQMLTQRVDEIANQLNQIEAQSSAAATIDSAGGIQLRGQTLYIVVEGDSLWSIAKQKLGSGTRYKEILALNPQIQKNQPLTIGSILKLPPRTL